MGEPGVKRDTGVRRDFVKTTLSEPQNNPERSDIARLRFEKSPLFGLVPIIKFN